MVISFLGSLAAGMLLALSTGSVGQIAWRFLRLVATLALALSCIAAAWVVRTPVETRLSAHGWLVVGFAGSALVSAALMVLAPISGRMSGYYRGLSLAGGLGGLFAICLPILETKSGGTGESWALLVLALVGKALSSMLLGSITVAWLLGHAYLTATRMTLAPLRHFSRLLSWVVATRILFLPLGLFGAWLMTGTSFSSGWSALEGWWLILVLRIGVGLLALAVFTYMIADCVRLRSTQSATGILYFGSVFAYIGELASHYLTEQMGWPV